MEEIEDLQRPYQGTTFSLSAGRSEPVSGVEDIKRTGNVWSASGMMLVAMTGSGILPLAWALAQLGWIFGPLAMLFFLAVTGFTSSLLSACCQPDHRHEDPTIGQRRNTYQRMTRRSKHYTYQDAVRTFLGERYVVMYGIVNGLNLFGMAIGDIILSSLSIVAIMKFHCFQVNHGKDKCHMNRNHFMIAIGVLQVFLSQIPALDKMWQRFYVEPFMTFIYSTFLITLGIAKISGKNYHSIYNFAPKDKFLTLLVGVSIKETQEFRGSLTGIISIGTVSLFPKISRIFLAVADIAFAYAFSKTIFEVQDKVESPPSGLRKMKKAIMISSTFMTFLYMLCSFANYAAFGDHRTPRDLLADFGFYNSFMNWLLITANVALIIQCVGAYQVHSRALSDEIEDAVTERFSTLNREITILNSFYPYKLNFFQLVWRTIFAVTTTLIAMLLPFFNDVVGLTGALGFWPLTVYLPVQMYIVLEKIPKWSTKWILLQILSILCFIITIAAAVGSIAGFVLDLETTYN